MPACGSRRRRLIGLATLGAGLLLDLALPGCVEHDLDKQHPNPCCGGGFSYPQSADRAVDLLFVIDDSGGMLNQQELLGNKFGALLWELQRLWGGLPDLHLGVTSTNLGAGGYDVTFCGEPFSSSSLRVSSPCPFMSMSMFSNRRKRSSFDSKA